MFRSLTVSVVFLILGGLSVQAQSVAKNVPVYLRALNGVDGQVIRGVPIVFSVGTVDQVLKDKQVVDIEVLNTSEGLQKTTLVGGLKYRASMAVLQNGVPVENGFYYNNRFFLIPRNTFVFTPPTDGAKFVDFLLQPASAVLEVAALDVDGTPLTKGYLEAFSAASVKDGLKEHRVGADLADLNGQVVTLALLPGRTYSLRLDLNQKDRAAPQPLQVLLSEGERRVRTLTLERPTHTIVVSPQTSETLDSVSGLFCYGYSESGLRSVGQSTDGVTVVLNVLKFDESWTVGCQLVATIGTQPRILKGKTSLELSAADQTNLSFSLEGAQPFYPEEVVGFDAQEEKMVVLQDGVTQLSFATGSIADSGTVSLSVSTGKGYTSDKYFEPVLAFDIRLFVNQQPISSVNKPVLLSMPVDAEALARLEADVEDAYPAYFDTESNSWRRETNFIYDSASNSLKVYVNHFSIWGVLVDLTKRLASKIPEELKVRRGPIIKQRNTKKGKSRISRKVKLRWDKPPAAVTGSPYVVEIAKRLRSKTGSAASGNRFVYSLNWDDAVEIQTKRRLVRRVLSKGTYQFRVTLLGADPSAPKQFRIR